MEERREALLWAKLGRGDASAYHPLICHLIDVALVARLMWEEVLTPAARVGLVEGLGLDSEVAGAWVAYLAGLHDLGKASPGFQAKDRQAPDRLAAAGLRVPPAPSDPGHGIVTALAMDEILTAAFGLPMPLARRLAVAIGGHHGILPQSRSLQDADNNLVLGGPSWSSVRSDLANALATVIGLPARAATPTRAGNATLMTLAGLVSVADWIGSDDRFFSYAGDRVDPSPLDLERYVERSRVAARDALTQLGWLGWTPAAERLSFEQLFPGLRPRPIQQRVGQLPELTEGPGLAILELPMGEGKTEAAFYLADLWGVALGQRGSYVAMPTMATSNQMFSRAHEFLSRRYPDGFNLRLLHSHAALAMDEEARDERVPPIEPQGVWGDTARDGAPAGVLAGEWFTRRKRGLLAPFGVGTVDQSLLAALQTRHVFVRLFGMAHKTVIFDEVHAYDVYMSTLFERLLAWLAALGCSVVILSATLPDARRRRLVEAYARGAGRSLDGPVRYAVYPRLTWLGAAGVQAESIAASPDSGKQLAIEWIDGQTPKEEGAPFPLGERLSAALADGGCAAVICNTVDRAQEVYRRLKPYFPGQADDGQPELDLFHARYLFAERQRRERRALARFGKPGGLVRLGDGDEAPVRRPRRAVLVATQVVEQSLDLDFDLMVSDAAPVDLLLQRSGRLHRHDRPDRPPALVTPTLWITRPATDTAGIPRFERGSEAIYDAHTLLRSWLALGGRREIRVPDDVEPLIEAVYDDRPCPAALSEPLRARWEETREARLADIEAEADEAKKRWLKPPTYGRALADLTADPREEDAPDFHQEHQALTRLAEPSVALVCLYGTEERPTLDIEGRDPIALARPPGVADAKRLLRHAVTVSSKRVIRQLLEREVPSGWRRSTLLRHHRLIVLDQFGRQAVGNYWIRLDPELGLMIEEGEGARR